VAHSLSDQFTRLLDLISELYPNTNDEEVLTDKDFLTKWAVALLVFETQSIADQPSFDDCQFILNLSTYQHLSFVIARRFYASHDPQDTGNRFDYGKERKSRESIREKIKVLTDIIVEFYTSHANQLIGDHQAEPVAEPMAGPQAERSTFSTSSEPYLRLVPCYSDSHPALNHDQSSNDDLSLIEQEYDEEGEPVSIAASPNPSPMLEGRESAKELEDAVVPRETEANALESQFEG